MCCRIVSNDWRNADMFESFIRRLFTILILLFLQGLILNRVQLFGYATPMLYILFILSTPLTASRPLLLLNSFLLGLGADMLTNTPGIAAASCTFLALCQPVLLRMLSSHESLAEVQPTLAFMGAITYLYYIGLASVLYYGVYYLLLSFSLVHPLDMLLNVAGGSVLTTLMLGALAASRKKKK